MVEVWQYRHFIRQCFRLSSVYVVEISWRVDRAAKTKTCNIVIIVIIEDMDDYHELYSDMFSL